MITTIVEVREARCRLPELIRQAHEGVEVIILRDGRPVAKIIPWPSPRPERRPGAWAGRVRYDSDIVESDEDVVAMFSELAGSGTT